MKPNIDQQIDCLRRELKRRNKLFISLVAEGRMEQDVATAEIAYMQAALETLTSLRGLIVLPVDIKV